MGIFDFKRDNCCVLTRAAVRRGARASHSCIAGSCLACGVKCQCRLGREALKDGIGNHAQYSGLAP
jgi:hypothetical protein